MTGDIVLALLIVALCGNLIGVSLFSKAVSQRQADTVFQKQEQEFYDTLKNVNPCPCEPEAADSSSNNS